MSLADRLQEIDAELDGFAKSDDDLNAVRARVAEARPEGLEATDAELESLAADVAGLDDVLAAAKAEADSRAGALREVAAQQAAEAAKKREAAEARLAEVQAESAAAADEARARAEAETARQARAKAERKEASANREAEAAARRAEREAAALAEAEAEATETPEREAREEQEGAASAEAAAFVDPPDTGSMEMLMGADEPASTEEEEMRLSLSDFDEGHGEAGDDGTTALGDELFGTDFGADSAATAESDVVTNESQSPSGVGALGDLADLFDDEDADAFAMDGAADLSGEVKMPKRPPPPPPVPGTASATPAEEAPGVSTITEADDEDFELFIEDEILEMDDIEIMMDEGTASTETELDGPPLSAEDLVPPDAQEGQSEGQTEGEAEEGEDGEKKGFFKKLFS